MKTIIGVVLISIFLILNVSAEENSLNWQIEKSQHFIINYQEAPPGFISELIYRAENYYNSIIDDLGYLRFDFWSWDNRAKIFLYKDSDEFHKNTDRLSWSGAIVSVANRTIQSFIGQPGFFDSILPHEMAHIIFREFVGGRVILPLWIDEGVACSQETSFLAGRMQIARKLVLQNNYLKLEKLFGIYKLSNDIQPQFFYSQSASIVNFLIRQHGRESFLDFSRKLRDGVQWQKALFSVYRFENLDEMESSWKAFISK